MQTWSDELKQSTVRHFRELSFELGPHGVGMKHWEDKFGLVSLDDAFNGRIVIQLRDGSGEERFETIEDAVGAGWAID